MAMDRLESRSELAPLREAFAHWFEDSFMGLGRFDGFGHIFAMDVRETDKEYIIEAQLPGFAPEELQVTASGDTVTIRAERKAETTKRQAEQEGTYLRHERYEGVLRRSVTLPSMQADSLRATYQQGVLTLHVPKTTQAKAINVPVQTNA